MDYIKELADYYKRYGYLNIIFFGNEGSGRSTLMLQVAKEISKEIDLKFDLNNLYLHSEEYKDINKLNLFSFMSKHDILPDLKLTKNINMFNIPGSYCNKTILSRLSAIGYFEATTFLADGRKGLRRGFFNIRYIKEKHFQNFNPLSTKEYKEYRKKKSNFMKKAFGN